jgi:hypothetical protein
MSGEVSKNNESYPIYRIEIECEFMIYIILVEPNTKILVLAAFPLCTQH